MKYAKETWCIVHCTLYAFITTACMISAMQGMQGMHSLNSIAMMHNPATCTPITPNAPTICHGEAAVVLPQQQLGLGGTSRPQWMHHWQQKAHHWGKIQTQTAQAHTQALTNFMLHGHAL